MNGGRIIVAEDEPETDVDEPTFNSSQVQIRKDRWVSDEFEILDFLGRGKFGEVKRCRAMTSGSEFAAKFICTPRAQDKKDVEHEVNVMRRLRHRRLVQVYDAFESRSQMCIIIEIINGGELFDRVISDEFVLTEKACVCIIRQICEGIEYMHSKNTIHLDLKPENVICLTKGGNRVKIIDFGLAREFDPLKDTRVLFGTPEFMAPEVVLFDPIHFATDMWSIGVMCYVLLSGLSPFMGNSDTVTLSNVTAGKYSLNYPEFQSVSDLAKDFIRKLLVLDKQKRMTASVCLEHPWLKSSATETETKNLEMSKEQMKAFVCRRKWQKAFNAIVALKRMRPTISTVTSSNLVDQPSRSIVDSASTNRTSHSEFSKRQIKAEFEPKTRNSRVSKKNQQADDNGPPVVCAGVTSKSDVIANGFDSKQVESQTTTSSNASKAKTAKDKDRDHAHRGQVLFKQSNKDNVPNFLRLRNIFSNNRA